MNRSGPRIKSAIRFILTFAITTGLLVSLPLSAFGQLPSWLPPHTDANGKPLDPVVYPHPSAYFTGVTALAFNRDGTEVAVGAGTSISMINVETGKPRAAWSAHNGLVTSLAFTAEGALVSTSSDGAMKYWDPAAGKEQRTAPPVKAFVALSPDGKLLAVSDSGGGEVQVKDNITGKKVRGFKVEKSSGGMMAMTINRRELAFIQGGYSPSASALAVSSDGRVLATGGSSVKLWDIATGKETGTLRRNSDSIAALAFSPDGKLLASGGLEHAVKVFDLAGNKELHTLTGHKNVVNAVAFSADGKLLATGSWDNTIKFWDVETGREVLTVGMKWLWEVVNARMVECNPKASSGSGAAPSVAIEECKILVTVRHNSKSTAWLPNKHYKIFVFQGPAKHMQLTDIGWKGEREMVKAREVTYAAVTSGEEAEFLMKFDIPKDANKKELWLVLLDASPVSVTAPN